MQTSKVNSSFYIFSVTIMSMIYIMPSIRIGFDYTRLALVSFLFYAIFMFKIEHLAPLKTIVLNLFPYMIISYFIAKPGNFKLGFLHPLLITWCMLFPAFLCKNIIKRGNKREMQIISVLTMLILLYVMYNTLDALSSSSDIIRELTASSLLDEDVRIKYALANVGGYGFAYGAGIIVVLLITLVFNGIKNKKLRYVVYFLLAFFSFFVLNAQFTTLLFLTCFCSILSLYYSDYGQGHKIQMLLGAITLVFLMPVLFHIIAELYQGSTIGDKLVRFNEAIFGGGDVTEASGQRSKFQIEAFELFISSPIWGSNVTTNSANAAIYGAAHSTMLSVACSTGLIGLISYYKTYWTIMKPIFKDYVYGGKQYMAIVLYFFCFSFFNPSETSESCWIIFLVVPLLFNTIKQLKI